MTSVDRSCHVLEQILRQFGGGERDNAAVNQLVAWTTDSFSSQRLTKLIKLFSMFLAPSGRSILTFCLCHACIKFFAGHSLPGLSHVLTFASLVYIAAWKWSTSYVVVERISLFLYWNVVVARKWRVREDGSRPGSSLKGSASNKRNFSIAMFFANVRPQLKYLLSALSALPHLLLYQIRRLRQCLGLTPHAIVWWLCACILIPECCSCRAHDAQRDRCLPKPTSQSTGPWTPMLRKSRFRWRDDRCREQKIIKCQLASFRVAWYFQGSDRWDRDC